MPDVQDRIDRLREFERRLLLDSTLLLDEHRDQLVRVLDDVVAGGRGTPHRRLATSAHRNRDRWARLLRDRRRILDAGHPALPPDEGSAGADDRAFYREYRRRLVEALDAAERALVTSPAPLPRGSASAQASDVARLIEHHDRVAADLYPHRYQLQ